MLLWSIKYFEPVTRFLLPSSSFSFSLCYSHLARLDHIMDRDEPMHDSVNFDELIDSRTRQRLLTDSAVSARYAGLVPPVPRGSMREEEMERCVGSFGRHLYSVGSERTLFLSLLYLLFY